MTDGLPGAHLAPALRLTVELAGIPGSGKSRLARTMLRELTTRGISVALPQAATGPLVPTGRRLARKVVAATTAVVNSPAETTALTSGVLRSRQPGAVDVARRLVQVLVAQDAAARSARRPGVSVLDEGLVQALWSIGLRGDVHPVLALLGDLPHRPTSHHLLVVLETSPDVALPRLAARPSQHSRTQSLGEHDRLAELTRGAGLLDELVAWWSNWAGASGQVVVVGSEESGPERDNLLDLICAIVGAGRPAPG